MQQRRDHGRQPLCQKTEQRQEKATGRCSGRALAAQRQNPRIYGQEPQKKAVPAFDLHTEIVRQRDKLFPQQHPAAARTDKVQQGSIRAFPQQQGDHRAQDQKQQHLCIAADRLPQHVPQLRREKAAQGLERIIHQLGGRYRALLQIRPPEVAPRKQSIEFLHPVMLPIRCNISSSRGHAAASTRHRPASPTHHARESAPASSQRVRV